MASWISTGTNDDSDDDTASCAASGESPSKVTVGRGTLDMGGLERVVGYVESRCMHDREIRFWTRKGKTLNGQWLNDVMQCLIWVLLIILLCLFIFFFLFVLFFGFINFVL